MNKEKNIKKQLIIKHLTDILFVEKIGNYGRPNL